MGEASLFGGEDCAEDEISGGSGSSMRFFFWVAPKMIVALQKWFYPV